MARWQLARTRARRYFDGISTTLGVPAVNSLTSIPRVIVPLGIIGFPTEETARVYTLYYSPATASMVVHQMLLEIGAPYRLELLDVERGSQRAPDYLRLNPLGRVPTLIVDGKPYFESAALVMLLAERHPEARLAPPPGSSDRAAWYQWIVFFANVLAPTYRLWFYPTDLGVPEHSPVMRDTIRKQIEDAWAIVDAHLQVNGPYMLGAEFTAVDLVATMYMRWSRKMPRTALEWPALRALADRVRARPSWAKMYEIEQLTEWRE